MGLSPSRFYKEQRYVLLPKSLCDERGYARHARYFAEGSSFRSNTPIYKIPMKKAR